MPKIYKSHALHDIQHLPGTTNHPVTKIMHNLKSNYDRFFLITKSAFKNGENVFCITSPYRSRMTAAWHKI
jgi:hypothetical protein